MSRLTEKIQQLDPLSSTEAAVCGLLEIKVDQLNTALSELEGLPPSLTIADTMPYPKIKSLYKRDPKTFIVLTDEYRTEELQMLEGMAWLFTEKIHGTNIRVHFDSVGNRVLFGGRTNKAILPKPLLAQLKEMFRPIMFREAGFDYDVTLYGEGFGLGIQKSGKNYIPDGVSFVLFDILCGDHWLGWHDVNGIAEKLSIDVVKTYGTGDLMDLHAYVKGGAISSAYGPDVKVEGIVARPQRELRDRHGDRIIVKLKGIDFTGEQLQ